MVTTPTPPAWSPPAAADNSLTFSFPGASATDTNSSAHPSCGFTATATVKIAPLWVSDAFSDNTIPPTVWLKESASASWTVAPSGNFGQSTVGVTLPDQPPPPPIPPVFTYTGGATNGLLPTPDPYIPSPLTGPPRSGSSTLSTAQIAPPDGWHQYPVDAITGKVIFPTRTLSANATATVNTPGGVNITGSLSYSISVHAQPYNFHKVTGAGKKLVTGEIDWVYAYSSTDGNLQGLTSCKWHEHLTYPGGPIGSQPIPSGYYPPNPPFGAPVGGYNNPTFSPDASMVPQLSLTATISDSTLVPTFVKPYLQRTFTTTQVFEFDDSATNDINTQIPGPDSGTFNIVRTVNYIDPSDYEYDVTKDSISDSLPLPD